MSRIQLLQFLSATILRYTWSIQLDRWCVIMLLQEIGKLASE
jgi:hypothetical protein